MRAQCNADRKTQQHRENERLQKCRQRFEHVRHKAGIAKHLGQPSSGRERRRQRDIAGKEIQRLPQQQQDDDQQ